MAIAAWVNWFGISFLPPRYDEAGVFSLAVDVWLWTNRYLSPYGWAAIIVPLLVWAYWPRYGYKPEKEMRWAQVILIVLVLAVGASLLLSWIGTDWAIRLRSIEQQYSGLTQAAAWVGLGFALVALCLNREVRDMLLGNGRALSIVSLGILPLVLLLVALGWVGG